MSKRTDHRYPLRKKRKLVHDSYLSDMETPGSTPMDIEKTSKEKRINSKKHDGNLLSWGKKIMTTFTQVKGGNPANRQEKLSIQHTFGKTKEQTSQLLRNYKKTTQLSTGKTQRLSFRDRYSMKSTSTTFRLGCGQKCQIEKGKQNLICPTCREFIYHRECLVKRILQPNLKQPNFEEDNWECPNCQMKRKLCAFN